MEEKKVTQENEVKEETEMEEKKVTQENEVKEETEMDSLLNCCCCKIGHTELSLEEKMEKKRQEIIHANKEFDNLEKELARQKQLKKYDDMTRDIKDIHNSLMNQGFTDEQAFNILMLQMESVLADNKSKTTITNTLFGTDWRKQ